MSNKKIIDKLNKLRERIDKHDNEFIERENRILGIVKNFIEYGVNSDNEGKRNASRKAALSYFIKRLIRTEVIAFVSITLSCVVSLISIYFLYQSNEIIKKQNVLMELEQRPYFSFTKPTHNDSLVSKKLLGSEFRREKSRSKVPIIWTHLLKTEKVLF